MMFPKAGETLAISDTGPLISIFQSNSLDVIATLIPVFHITSVCRLELSKHGWDHAVRAAEDTFRTHKLSIAEEKFAYSIAWQVAQHRLSTDPVANNHLGEAEAMVLAARPEFRKAILLLDEKAARMIAKDKGFTISGFAGILLGVVRRKLLTPEELRTRMKVCQHLGTHYSDSFIEEVYLMAKGVK